MQTLNSHSFEIETTSDISKLLNNSDQEELFNEFKEVTLVFNNKEKGNGNVHLTNLKLIWLNNDHNRTSFSFPYKSIMFHAISKDTNLFRNPCIFIQLNLTEEEEDNQTVLLSPSDPTLLEHIFEQISKLSTFNDTYSSSEYEDNCEIYEECDDEDS